MMLGFAVVAEKRTTVILMARRCGGFTGDVEERGVE